MASCNISRTSGLLLDQRQGERRDTKGDETSQKIEFQTTTTTCKSVRGDRPRPRCRRSKEDPHMRVSAVFKKGRKNVAERRGEALVIVCFLWELARENMAIIYTHTHCKSPLSLS